MHTWFSIIFFFTMIVLLYRNLIIDDAFTTFQYAKSFAEHFKPWYNLDHFCTNQHFIDANFIFFSIF